MESATSRKAQLEAEINHLRPQIQHLINQLAQYQQTHAALTAHQAHVKQQPPAQQKPLPQNWTEQINPDNNQVYYWNTLTHESTYTRPVDEGQDGFNSPNLPPLTNAKGPPGANLFVVRKIRKGEYDSFSSEDLRREFSKFGTVTRAEMTLDKNTGWSRGFGFISFATVAEADAALAALSGTWVAGREIKVEKTNEDS